METGNFSPVMVVGHDGHGHHGPPWCLGMKDLGVEASHVTLGILVKAGENQSSFDQIHNVDMAQVSIHNIISGWWFGTWILWFSIYWEFHHPNWISYFFRGVETTNQMLWLTSNYLYTYIHISKNLNPKINKYIYMFRVRQIPWFLIDTNFHRASDAVMLTCSHLLQATFREKRIPIARKLLVGGFNYVFFFNHTWDDYPLVI